MRWDVAQMLYAAELRRNLTRYQQGKSLEFSAEVLAELYQILDGYQQDPELATSHFDFAKSH